MVKHRRPWRLIRYARRIVYLCFDLFGELQSVQNVRHLAWRVQRPSRPARWVVVRQCPRASSAAGKAEPHKKPRMNLQ